MKNILFEDLKPLSDEEILVVLKKMKEDFSRRLKISPTTLYYFCIDFAKIYLNGKGCPNANNVEITEKLFPQISAYKPRGASYAWFGNSESDHRKRMKLLSRMIKDYTKKVKDENH